MDRASYKSHPFWQAAIELAQDAYRLAERVRPEDPLAARHLRGAAVAAPAHVAGVLDAPPGRPCGESAALARGALAEVERQARRLPPGLRDEGEALARRARALALQMAAAAPVPRAGFS
jgi:hypothetical protein